MRHEVDEEEENVKFTLITTGLNVCLCIYQLTYTSIKIERSYNLPSYWYIDVFFFLLFLFFLLDLLLFYLFGCWLFFILFFCSLHLISLWFFLSFFLPRLHLFFFLSFNERHEMTLFYLKRPKWNTEKNKKRWICILFFRNICLRWFLFYYSSFFF